MIQVGIVTRNDNSFNFQGYCISQILKTSKLVRPPLPFPGLFAENLDPAPADMDDVAAAQIVDDDNSDDGMGIEGATPWAHVLGYGPQEPR